MLRNKDSRLCEVAPMSPGGQMAPYLTDKVSVEQKPPTEGNLIPQHKQFAGQPAKVEKLKSFK